MTDENQIRPVALTIERSAPWRIEAGGPQTRILVIASGEAKVFPCQRGTYTLGRSADADMCIAHPRISRRHAAITVDSTVYVEDLGSRNGTVVGGRHLHKGERTPLLPGESIMLDPEVLVLIQAAARESLLRRLLPHGYFEARVAEECTRCQDSMEAFAIAMFRARSPTEAAILEGVLSDVLAPTDVLALFGPGHYEAALLPRSPEAAKQDIDTVLTQAAAENVEVTSSAAFFPWDGRQADALLSACMERLQGFEPDEETPRVAVTGCSTMEEVWRIVSQVAPTDLSVLLLGESGVGKGLVASEIHARSERANQPFVALNCGAFTETLLESELFGHARGSFTGASSTKRGLFEQAHDGSVFLDEVGEMPPSLQVRLLRVLEEGEIRRVGENEPRKVNVRIISATNRNLEAEIEAGRFRHDLFYRLNGINVTIPPLRQRVPEITQLAHQFVAAYAARLGRPPPAIDPAATELLQAYWWPGNVRELRNFMERAVVLCGDRPIEPEHLPSEVMGKPLAAGLAVSLPLAARPTARPSPPPAPSDSKHDMTESGEGVIFDVLADEAAVASADDVAGAERKRIIRVLVECNGNQSRAAKMLGISRNTLAKRMRDHGLSTARHRKR